MIEPPTSRISWFINRGVVILACTILCVSLPSFQRICRQKYCLIYLVSIYHRGTVPDTIVSPILFVTSVMAQVFPLASYGPGMSAMDGMTSRSHSEHVQGM